MKPPTSHSLATLRRYTLALFGLGAAGTAAELVLLGHTEDRWQLVPLALLGLSVVGFIGLVAFPRSGGVRLFRALMVLFIVSGLVGVFQHYVANAEFELEMYPSLAGMELVWESLQGATPALAPATMSFLGLLGLAATYRHPKGDLE